MSEILAQNQSVKSKNKFWIILVSIISVSVVVIVGITFFIVRDNNAPTSKLTIQVQEKRKVTANTATINLTISETGTDTSKLNTSIDQKSQKVVNYLKSEGLAENDLQLNKNTYEDYGSIPFGPNGVVSPAAQNQLRSEANIQVIFKLDKVGKDKPNQVLQKTIELGVNRFNGYNYTIDNQDEICQEMKNKAVEKAVNQAKDQVKTLGGGRIVRSELNNNQYGCGNGFFNPMAMTGSNEMFATSKIADSQNNIPPILVGEQELNVNVEVSVEYKQN